MKNFGLMGEEVKGDESTPPSILLTSNSMLIIAIGNREATTVTWFWLTSLSNFLHLMTLTFSKIGAEITNQLDLKLHIRYYLSP